MNGALSDAGKIMKNQRLGKQTDSGEVLIRAPRVEDGRAIWELVDQCRPLDLNSCYAYCLIGRDFSGTSVVAEEDGKVVGFISAYRRPADPENIFIWQVAIHSSQRGKGLARSMLLKLLEREACGGVRFLETTVTPSNKPSRALFSSLAREMECRLIETEGFPADIFPGDQSHEEERLLRIGPFRGGASRKPESAF